MVMSTYLVDLVILPANRYTTSPCGYCTHVHLTTIHGGKGVLEKSVAKTEL